MTDAPPTGDGAKSRPSIAEVAAWLRRSAAEQRDREGKGDDPDPLAWPPADVGASTPVGASPTGPTRPGVIPSWAGAGPSASSGPGEAMNAATPARADQDLAHDDHDDHDDDDLGDRDHGDGDGDGDVGDGPGDAPTTAPPPDPPGNGDDRDADSPTPPPEGASGLSTDADLSPARSVSQDAEAAPDDEAERQERVDPERPHEAAPSDARADFGAPEPTKGLLVDAPRHDEEPPEHAGAAPAKDLSEPPLADPPVEVEVRSSGLGQPPDPTEAGPGAAPDGEDLREAAPPPAEPAGAPPADPGSGQQPPAVGGTTAISLFDLDLVELANRARASARQDLAAQSAEADREGSAASVVGGPSIEAARAEPPAQDESTIAFDLRHDDDLEDDRPLELETTTATDGADGADGADESDSSEGTDEDDQAPVAARRHRPTRTRYPRGQLREPIGILRRIRAMLGVVVVTVVLGIAAGAAFGAVLLFLAFAVRNAITSQ